jgi:hypothetical protein
LNDPQYEGGRQMKRFGYDWSACIIILASCANDGVQYYEYDDLFIKQEVDLHYSLNEITPNPDIIYDLNDVAQDSTVEELAVNIRNKYPNDKFIEYIILENRALFLIELFLSFLHHKNYMLV